MRPTDSDLAKIYDATLDEVHANLETSLYENADNEESIETMIRRVALSDLLSAAERLHESTIEPHTTLHGADLAEIGEIAFGPTEPSLCNDHCACVAGAGDIPPMDLSVDHVNNEYQRKAAVYLGNRAATTGGQLVEIIDI